MTKRLLLLSGLSILLVVLGHAAGYGQLSLFLWVDRYLDVSTPYWDALGSVAHYALIVVRSTGMATVPAFLFISGFFAAYLARGRQQDSIWKLLWTRIVALLVPYLIWSALVFAAKALEGNIGRPADYLFKLVAKGAAGPFYYIPLLCYCYLLSPLIVRALKARPGLLLSALAVIQLSAVVVRYLDLLGVKGAGLSLLFRITPDWSVTRWVFFFALGVFSALYVRPLKKWLATHKWHLLVATIGLWVLNILEGDLLLSVYHRHWFAGISSLSYHFGAAAAVLCFLAFDDLAIPYSKRVFELGKRSYGIFLIHYPIVETLARAIRLYTPSLMAHLVLLVPLLFVVGLAVPLGLMALVNRSPMRKYSRYLFG